MEFENFEKAKDLQNKITFLTSLIENINHAGKSDVFEIGNVMHNGDIVDGLKIYGDNSMFYRIKGFDNWIIEKRKELISLVSAEKTKLLEEFKNL